VTFLLLAVLSNLTLNHEVGLGADYTNQTYGIIDYDTIRNPDVWDTLDVESEARGFWNLDLDAEKGGTRFTLGNDASISTRSVREALNLTFGQDLLPGARLEFADDAEVRYYHRALPQLADTGFQKNYLSNTSELALDLDLSEALTLSASEELQLFHYPEPDSYNYDYLLNRAGAGAHQELGGISSLDLAYEWARRWAAAADGQDYVEHNLDTDLDLYFDLGPRVNLTNTVGRRRYPEASRSYWEELLGVHFAVDVGSAVELSLDDEPRWTWYDAPTAVYSNLFENSLKLAVEWRATTELSFRAGPQHDAGWGLPTASSDDYRELSAFAGIDYMKLDRLWFSVEDRLGLRLYPLADSSFQSNYLFNEFNLMVNWTIFKTAQSELSLNGMAVISPEWHADKSSDLSTRIFTLELKYGL
jgi:hypothetical protein